MNKCVERLYNGLIKENPTFVLTLGMCPTLAVTTSAINGIGMGLSSTVVLVMSNLMISLLRKIIPDGVRMPAFIVIVASFVTMVQFLMQGYLPSLYDSLGIYIPLIVVNCIILGRAEAYASKNPVLPSAFDGLGMGLGFTCAITILGAVRELIGAGTILSTGSSALVTIPESVYTPASIFILAPGAFFVLAMCIAIMNKIKAKHGMEPAQVPDYCSKDGSCDSCANIMCGGKAFAEEKKQRTDQLLYTSPIRSGSIVFGKYLNCGQTCVAPDYVYCHSEIKDEFLKQLRKQIRKQFGKAPLDNKNYGKIINQKHFDRIQRLIDSSKVICGGNIRPKTLQIEPTVMDKVTFEDAIMQEEIFGPVLPVLTFTSIDEVIHKVNSLAHPLALYIFAQDKAIINKVTSECGFGGGCINDVVIHLATSELPFGGFGESGMGSYHGKKGFETFSHYKSIVDKKTWMDLPIRYQPYGRISQKLLHLFLK